jgi:hypothetical protein
VKQLGILYRDNAIVPKDAVADASIPLYHWEVKSAGRPWLKLEPSYKLNRPQSSYAFFMRDARQSVAEEYPEKSPREFMTEEFMTNVAVAWRATDESVKNKYVEMAEVDKQRYNEELKKIKEKTEVAPEITEGFVRLVYNGTVYSNAINIGTVIRRQVYDAKRTPHRFSASNSEFQQRCYGVAQRISALYTPQASPSTGLSMQVFRDRVRRLPEYMKMDLQDILNLCRHRFRSRKPDEHSKFVRMVEFCEPTIRLNPLALTRKLKQIYSGQKITLSMDNRELEHSDGESQDSSSPKEEEDLSEIEGRESGQESQDSSGSETDEDMSEAELSLFDTLTEDDLETIRAVFDQYDTNNNDKLSIDEFTQQTNLYREDIAKMINEHDTDSDGFLSYSEFQTWCVETNAVEYWAKNRDVGNDSKLADTDMAEKDRDRSEATTAGDDNSSNNSAIVAMVTDDDMTEEDEDMATVTDDDMTEEDEDKSSNNNANTMTDDDMTEEGEDNSSENVYSALADQLNHLAEASDLAATAATALAAIDAQTTAEEDKQVNESADGDDKSSENSATAAATEEAKNVNERGSDKWINVLERPAEHTLVKINNQVGILEYGKQHWNQLEGTDIKVNGWSNGKVRVQSTEKESSAEREQAVPAADNSNGEGSMYNMSSDWATSDDELNFAEDSANEFEEEAMAFVESSSGHDTSELVFAETSSGNDANEMVFAGSSESFSSALEFAESSDFAMTSDSDTGQ